MDNKHAEYLLNEYYLCQIKPSKIHGVGVFALKNIPKGTDIFKSVNQTFSGFFKINKLNVHKNVVKDLKMRTWSHKDEVFVDFNFCFNKHYSKYINHSEQPNILYYFDEIINQWVFMSLQDIKEGEELTYDYTTVGKKYIEEKTRG